MYLTFVLIHLCCSHHLWMWDSTICWGIRVEIDGIRWFATVNQSYIDYRTKSTLHKIGILLAS